MLKIKFDNFKSITSYINTIDYLLESPDWLSKKNKIIKLDYWICDDECSGLWITVNNSPIKKYD